MLNLVKIPLLLALWGSFAHAGIAESGIECGGAEPTRLSAYLSIRLVPVNGHYDLILDRINSTNTINLMGRTLATGLSCAFQEAPVVKAVCNGGTAASPERFRVTEKITRNENFYQSGFQIEAQSDAVATIKDQGFDGETIWPANATPSADTVLELLLAGGYGCRPLARDMAYTGRWISVSNK